MNLSPSTKLQLERRARQTKDVYERLRLCVILARSEGMSPESIAQAHRISLSSVYKDLTEFENENKTQHEERGGVLSKLTTEQAEELRLHLQQITYLHTKDICKYVKDRYGVTFSRSGMKVMIREYETVNAENMIDYFKNLEIYSLAPKIHVICDNGRANKNKALEEDLKTSRIQMHYLPPYSPNLNAIERLWKVMREIKTYNKCYESFAEFGSAIRSFFFEDIPKIRPILEKRINDNFQRIELNSIKLAMP